MSGGTPAFHREIRRGEPWSGRAQNESTRGKAREKANRHPNGEILLDNADAVIDALHLLIPTCPRAFMFVLTPSPPALRSPLSPKGAREETFLVLMLYSCQSPVRAQVMVRNYRGHRPRSH